MRSPTPLRITALLAASAASMAFSQANPTPQQPQPSRQEQQSQPPKRSTQPSAMPFVQEPVATATQAQGSDAQLGDSIVKALDADPSLKDSKITVQPEDGKVLLTGATLTRAQKQRAGEIAIAQAGQGKVVNIILDDET